MAELNKKSYRLLRYLVTIMLIAVLMTGATYGSVDDKTVTNEFMGEPSVTPPVDKTVTVNVTKVWDPANGHPDSVTVQLYRDGEPYGSPETLNANNNWTFRWTELKKDNTWTVDEPDVPKGYVKKVTGSATDGFIITNTRETTKKPPVRPPTKPPTDTPGDYAGIDTIDIGEENPPTAGKDPEPGKELPIGIPKTGDGADPRPWLIILAASTILLRKALFFRKRHEFTRNQK
ncbi:MAG: Cna B-type domain-containing protein [Clostridiales bacterium]|nr:Cna B-type domain-containing protein [Clostridiales bacterium]